MGGADEVAARLMGKGRAAGGCGGVPPPSLFSRGHGQGGGGGGAPFRGYGGCPPRETNQRGEKATLATRPRGGPLTLANPQPTRVGKIGGGGGGAPSRGVWGASPQKNQSKGREAPSCNSATSGTLNPGKPSANEGGEKEGVQGSPAYWHGGCAPTLR